MTDAGCCPKCGKDLVDVCPECRQPVETYSRVCGYLRPTSTWNAGKQQEFVERKEYDLGVDALRRKSEQLKGDHADER